MTAVVPRPYLADVFAACVVVAVVVSSGDQRSSSICLLSSGRRMRVARRIEWWPVGTKVVGFVLLFVVNGSPCQMKGLWIEIKVRPVSLACLAAEACVPLRKYSGKLLTMTPRLPSITMYVCWSFCRIVFVLGGDSMSNRSRRPRRMLRADAR